MSGASGPLVAATSTRAVGRAAWRLHGTARLVVASLLAFAGTRVVTSGFLLWLTTRTTAASEAGDDPSFAGISSVWDGRWYRRIALHGYPSTLPTTPDGSVQQNAWAFLPAYPWLSRAVAGLTGLEWAVAAIAVSMLFGALAAVLVALLLRPHIGSRRAFTASVLFSCSPVAFVLQTTYADSMMVCLLLAGLCLLERRRYLAAVPVVLLASFTRPGVLAFALTCVVHVVLRRRELFARPAEAVRPAVLLLAAVTGGLAWPVVVALATGRPDGYLLTETAWRSLWTGSATFDPFSPWLFVAQQLFGPFGLPVLGLVIGLFVHLVVRRMRGLGATTRIWSASYGLYLLAVFMPQTSLPRLLLPLAPALGAARFRRRRSLIAAAVVSTALQLLWLWCTYGPVKTWLTVP